MSINLYLLKILNKWYNQINVDRRAESDLVKLFKWFNNDKLWQNILHAAPFGGYVDSLADFNHLTDIGLLDLSYFFQSIARSRFITYHKKLPRILG